MIVDQTNHGHIQVTGADRVRFLQGMCTANVETLGDGDWLRASVLDHRGRVQSIIEIANRGDDLLITCELSLRDKTVELLGKYAIMDEVEFVPLESVPMHRVWDSAEAVWSAAPVFAPPPEPIADADDIEIRRIEAGMPRYGVDVSADHFPFESLLIRHVDYDKGCYLGQEPVSRVHHRGKPNKAMRGLQIEEGDGPIPAGTEVVHADRAKAGVVTSSAVSPRFGVIALAYVHRQVNEPGGRVTVAGRAAALVELPFE